MFVCICSHVLITTNRSSFVVCSLLVRSSFTGSSISSSQTELSPSESSSFSLEGFRRVCPHNQQHRQVKMLCKQSLIFNITRALQPVATCRQLPHLRPVLWATKPAILIMTSLATELATPSVTDVRTATLPRLKMCFNVDWDSENYNTDVIYNTAHWEVIYQGYEFTVGTASPILTHRFTYHRSFMHNNQQSEYSITSKTAIRY